MLAEQVLGNLREERFQNKKIDQVEIEWHEAFKKLHRKTTKNGRELGIRLDNEILTKGLNQDDVLYEGEDYVIAVDIPPCEVIRITAEARHEFMLVKAAYEVGNRHATLFWGDSHGEIMTPFTQPLYELLEKIHGIQVVKEQVKLNFNHSISSSINNHTH